MLLDTCALLWWTLDPSKLSPLASRHCARIWREGAAISSISLWEIGTKIKRKNLDIGASIAEYTARLKDMNILEIVPVDETIWIGSLELRWEHRDPADRVIVATARLRDMPIITADPIIRRFYQKVIW